MTRYVYRRMTPEQLSLALYDLRLKPSQFAFITGFNDRKVELWLKGREDIPATCTVMCGLLALPGGVERAMTISQLYITSEEEEKPPPPGDKGVVWVKY